MHLGLLRKHRGMLLATPRGRELRGDPVGLWWHLARQLPPAKAVGYARHAGMLLLASVAAGPDATGYEQFDYVARMLGEAGWALTDGTPVTSWEARDVAAGTYERSSVSAHSPETSLAQSQINRPPTARHSPSPPSAPGHNHTGGSARSRTSAT